MKIPLAIKKDDFKATDWGSITPAQYFLHSLFKSFSIMLGNQQIVYTPQIYGYRAYIEALLGYSSNAKKSHLSSALWGRGSERKVAIASETYTKDIVLVGKLHSDAKFQERALIGWLDLNIKLVSKNKSYYLEYPKDLNVKVEFLDASFFVYRIKATQDLLSAHIKALNVSTVKYPITRTEIKQVTIPSGGQDAMIDNIVLKQLSRRVLIACVENDPFNGSKLKNPYKFDHFDINYLTLFLDGTQYLAKAYQPNFEKGEVNPEFYGLFQALDQNSTS